jgi:rare lipoprotein A
MIGCAPSARFSSNKVEKYHKNVQIGIASFYAEDFHGRKTANGEIFDMHSLTAAHPSLPFNTKVKVTNLRNNKSVVLRINDRGPFVSGRIIDVSLEAAKKLDMISDGTAKVKIEILEFGK